ncbi:high-temperature-induced dauer-formation protein-domain-containing protein [Chytriomyces sp. MP71]|nr:high-temperature-induced dauer-formation protein-domain-containing protein [Chytriomyces sp. MP71]
MLKSLSCSKPGMGASESKVAFRKGVYAVASGEQAITEEFLAQFFLLPDTESCEDVFNFLAPKDVRQMRDEREMSFAGLVSGAVAVIAGFEPDHAKDPVRLKLVTNCLRILTRVLPFVFETGLGSTIEDSLESRILWSHPTPSASPDAPDTPGSAPLGIVLAKALARLLFTKGFTLLPHTQTKIWEHGIACLDAPGQSAATTRARIDCLRLLQTMLSAQMYYPPALAAKVPNRFALVLCRGCEPGFVQGLMVSLLNTALAYDPVGWGLVPYNHVVFGDANEQLVTVSVQTLVALLDFGAIKPLEGLDIQDGTLAKGVSDATSNESEPVKKAPFGNNDFRYFVSKIKAEEDLAVIVDGIARILLNPLQSANTYLPGSTKKVSVHVEVIMLFWKLHELNEHFAAFVRDSDKILIITAALIYFMMESRTNPNEIGLVRQCCFLLHIFSQERDYAVRLNAPFDASTVGAAAKHLPIFSNGTWGDFFVLSIHTLVTSTSKTPIATLHETMLMTLSNISAYLKSLTVVTVNKLMSLFAVLSNPAFLVSSEANHKLIFYLVDLFNGCVQYQISGNSQLVYALVRNRARIVQLNELTFEDAMAELKKVREAKLARASGGLVGAAEAAAAPADEAKGKAVLENKFQATAEWFNYWKSHLRLNILVTLVDALGPKIEAFCLKEETNDDKKAIDFLNSGTMVGLLPLPQPLFTRKFSYTEAVRVWFTSYMWGNIYIKCANPSGGAEVLKHCPSIWTGTNVHLFAVKIADEDA